jgi:single-stranded DNA-binding protein
MTAFAIITGALFKAPEQKQSKAGKPFVSATVKCGAGEQTQWWRVIAFSETAQAELLRLGDGDAVSVQGSMKAEIYQRDGSAPRVSLSITADNVLALRQPPKQAKTRAAIGKTARSAADPGQRQSSPSGRDFADTIPF